MSINYGVYALRPALDLHKAVEENRNPQSISKSSAPQQQTGKVAPEVFKHALVNAQNVLLPLVPTELMQCITKKSTYELAKKISGFPQLKKDYPSEDAIKNDIYSGNR